VPKSNDAPIDFFPGDRVFIEQIREMSTVLAVTVYVSAEPQYEVGYLHAWLRLPLHAGQLRSPDRRCGRCSDQERDVVRQRRRAHGRDPSAAPRESPQGVEEGPAEVKKPPRSRMPTMQISEQRARAKWGEDWKGARR
jgi:hypothetical protein